MNTFKILIIFLFAITLTACSDSDSSTEESGSETTMDNGVTVTFSSNEITAGEVITLTYNFNGLVGTIHWGDSTTTRVRDSGEVRHGYSRAGTYIVGIQIDNQGDGERVGLVVANPEEVEEIVESSSSTRSSTKMVSMSGNISARGERDRSTIRIRNARPGDTVTISLVCSDGTIDPVLAATDPNGMRYSNDDGGTRCDSFRSSLIDSVPAVNGDWDIISRSFGFSQTGPYILTISVTGSAFVTFR